GFGLGRTPAGGAASSSGAVPESDPVLACLLPGEPSDVDTIAERSGLSTAGLLTRLFELELAGLVGRAAGGRFVRFDRTWEWPVQKLLCTVPPYRRTRFRKIERKRGGTPFRYPWPRHW